ncbi:PR-1-like protein [Piromyces finnis]|uniref:PR-1-like protein n=1 Tax=Piromyces finnis TaxID=1754191 RepID=A0A1Y1VEV8_9FUNG|nr:PR-1-like protein [Piromyces finnis]|eukprot:ORX54645.1 PR-1-like protein [Piromyces finnis]
MKKISWSDKLENDAQKYVDGCPGLNHSDRDSRDGHGENISFGSGSIESLFNLWTDEKNNFLKSNYASNFKGIVFNGKQIGHYSQVVWAENTQVGCGLADCNGSKNLVCRYGNGNKIGEKVYSISIENKEEDPKIETKHESKLETKVEIKSTTTIKRTTTTMIKKKTTTTTTTIDVTITKPVVSATNIENDLNDSSNKLAYIATELPVVTNTTITLTTNKTNIVNQVVSEKPKKSEKTNNVKISSHPSNNSYKEIQVNENEGDGGIVITGVALTGSVIGAAAAFAFVKKNPRQYEELKRNISKKATNVKRGATILTRKLTTKKVTPPSTHNNSANDYEFNYRATFADSMVV